MTATESPSTTPSEATVLKAVQSLGAVIGPTALVTGLLFYFGWVRTQSEAQYLGLDVTLFGFSTQDYVLQSTYSVLIPLGELLICGLFLLWLHTVLTNLIDRRARPAIWPWAEGLMALAGAAHLAIGLLENSNRYPTDFVLLITPLCLTLAVALTSYAVLLHRRRQALDGPAKASHAKARGVPLLSIILVTMLLAVGVVWEVANYAEIKGRKLGQFLVSQLAFQPGVVVYSPKSLHIDAPGVVETRLSDPESAYGFRYTGLKLLFRSNGRYFLMPDSWSTNGGTAIVLLDSPALRLEFIRAPG